MTTIAQISDLHFNRVDRAVCEGLKSSLLTLAPDLIVVSGDVTQRARTGEFRAFKEYIDQFPFPKLIVPGNHDVSLTNPFQRFLSRLGRFRAMIESDPTPVYEDPATFVIGIDTTKSFTVSGGKLGRSRVGRVHERLEAVDEKKVRVLVCHHPVHRLPGRHSDWVDGMALLEKRVDVILSGHHHLSESEVKVEGGSTLLVRAGTATSTRQRGEENSYNVLRIEGPAAPKALVEVWRWDEQGKKFSPKNEKRYTLENGVWK